MQSVLNHIYANLAFHQSGTTCILLIQRFFSGNAGLKDWLHSMLQAVRSLFLNHAQWTGRFRSVIRPRLFIVARRHINTTRIVRPRALNKLLAMVNTRTSPPYLSRAVHDRDRPTRETEAPNRQLSQAVSALSQGGGIRLYSNK